MSEGEGSVSRICYVFYVRMPGSPSGATMPFVTETQQAADDHPWRCTNVVRVEVPL